MVFFEGKCFYLYGCLFLVVLGFLFGFFGGEAFF